jgi:AcrR family transcriptional regulator
MTPGPFTLMTMPPPRPAVKKKEKARDRGDLDGKTALLDAACRSIAQKGLRGLRVEEVARDAGVALSLIYYYFGDRATLLRSALEHVGQRAASYTEVDDETSGRDALIASLVAEIQDVVTIRENSGAWGEFRDAAVFDELLRPTLFRYTREWIDDVTRLVRRGQSDGTIATDVPAESVGQHLTALTEGLSTRWLAGFVTTKQARAELRRAIEQYLGPEPARPSSRSRRR